MKTFRLLLSVSVLLTLGASCVLHVKIEHMRKAINSRNASEVVWGTGPVATAVIQCDGKTFASVTDLTPIEERICWAEMLRTEREQQQAECAAERKADPYASCDSDKYNPNKI